MRIAAGKVFLLASGAYSDYEVHRCLRALRDIDLDECREKWAATFKTETRHDSLAERWPGRPARTYQYPPKRFEDWFVKEYADAIEVIETGELHCEGMGHNEVYWEEVHTA